MRYFMSTVVRNAIVALHRDRMGAFGMVMERLLPPRPAVCLAMASPQGTTTTAIAVHACWESPTFVGLQPGHGTRSSQWGGWLEQVASVKQPSRFQGLAATPARRLLRNLSSVGGHVLKLKQLSSFIPW